MTKPKICPRLRILRSADADGVSFEATLAEDFTVHEEGGSWVADKGTWVANVDAEYKRDTDLEIGRIEVEPFIQRCGVGTQLYTRVMQEAKRKGMRMVSDSHRSELAESFWQKQKRKNRAECISEPGERGHLYAPSSGEGRKHKDHWKCRRWGLKLSTKSLRGKK